MGSIYNPIQYSSITRLYYDRFVPVAATPATAGYGARIKINLKLNHKQKFGAAGVNNTTVSSVFMIIQGNVAAGTAAPNLVGYVSVYFDPT